VGVGSGLYTYDVVKRSRSLSHLLMSSCSLFVSVPCARLGWPSRHILSARTYRNRIVS